MARPLIQLVLADDWELRGDGSGNIRAIQFGTLRKLREVYERHGLRASFNAEVLQQLGHLRFADDHAELHDAAMEWEELVRETYARGHDVQLHVHPQWTDAAYEGGRWALRAPWSILDHPPEGVRSLLAEAKAYLEDLLRRVEPRYRCLSFRSGSWCIAPGAHVLPVLAELGIVFDTSIVDGLVQKTAHVDLDYREIDEPFLPYYPRMEDARRMAETPQPVVEVPTHSFRGTLRPLVLRALAKKLPYARRLLSRYLAPSDVAIESSGYASDYGKQVWSRPRRRLPRRELVVSDLAMLNYPQMRHLLDDVRRRAAASGWPVVPVVLENHTKDIGNFEPIERFAAYVASAPDLEVITLAELAEGLHAGRYPVKMAAAA